MVQEERERENHFGLGPHLGARANLTAKPYLFLDAHMEDQARAHTHKKEHTKRQKKQEKSTRHGRKRSVMGKRKREGKKRHAPRGQIPHRDGDQVGLKRDWRQPQQRFFVPQTQSEGCKSERERVLTGTGRGCSKVYTFSPSTSWGSPTRRADIRPVRSRGTLRAAFLKLEKKKQRHTDGARSRGGEGQIKRENKREHQKRGRDQEGDTKNREGIKRGVQSCLKVAL